MSTRPKLTPPIANKRERDDAVLVDDQRDIVRLVVEHKRPAVAPVNMPDPAIDFVLMVRPTAKPWSGTFKAARIALAGASR